MDDALCVIEGLSFLSPRGKQQLALFSDKLVVRTAKADLCVPWAAIKHVAIMDSIPGDTKGKVLLYLHVDSETHPVMNGKSPLTAVVIQTTADARLDCAHPQGGGRLAGAAPVVLCQALGAVPGGVDPACFVSPDSSVFQSADKATGMGAHVKARSGFLYPLPTALVFLETPALFLPHSAIKSVEMMRAGGSSSTFDLVVHLRSGKQQEFGFIGAREAAGLEDYIRQRRLALGAAESGEEEEEGSEGEGGSEEAADSDDEEDSDFNPSDSSSEEEEEEEEAAAAQRSGGSGKRKRSALAGASDAAGPSSGGAAASGDEGGSDEEEDEDEEEEEESSSDEDSDDDGSVELVSEDDLSLEQLKSAMAEQGGRKPKRQRT